MEIKGALNVIDLTRKGNSSFSKDTLNEESLKETHQEYAVITESSKQGKLAITDTVHNEPANIAILPKFLIKEGPNTQDTYCNNSRTASSSNMLISSSHAILPSMEKKFKFQFHLALSSSYLLDFPLPTGSDFPFCSSIPVTKIDCESTMPILVAKHRTRRSKIKFSSSDGAEKLEPITSKEEERPGEKKRRNSDMCSEEESLCKRTRSTIDTYNTFSTTIDIQSSEQL